MRLALVVWVIAVVVACGGVASSPPPPLQSCTKGAACSTNPGAPCLIGATACEGDEATCVDVKNAADGTSCATGACTRGACLAPVTINANLDLSTTPVTLGRACAETPAFAVTALTASQATLTAAPEVDCLRRGDEIVLIDLQGAPGAIGNVGNWELLEVGSVTGNVVAFKSAKTRSYGAGNGDAGIGAGAADQKVALVRVANFGTVAVTATATVTTAAWNGASGGVLAIRAATLHLDGALSAAGLGYRTGDWSEDDQTCSESLTTKPGESIAGPATAGSTASNAGAPGGIGAASGISFTSTPLNSGASHATAGGMGSNGNGRTIGPPGAVYGVADASQLTMGSGPSGNLTCANGFAGPALIADGQRLAGGIVLLFANELDVGSAASITASAKASTRDISASGGYVFVRGGSLALGTGRVTAIGGVATGSGGTLTAGDGYIVVSGTTVTGTTKPTAHQL